MSPHALNVKGGTQPEIYQGTVDAIVHQLLTDTANFWRHALAMDGPIEIWEINGERWLYNGNHRYQAAIKAGVDIPDTQFRIVQMHGSTIPTWRFDQMTWLTATK